VGGFDGDGEGGEGVSASIAQRVQALSPKHRALLAVRLGLPSSAGSAADRRLVAYAVLRKKDPPGVSDLRKFAQRDLPEHMIPAVFVILDALPVTSSGKVDRAALPGPDGSRPALKESYVAPRTAMERSVGAAWQEVLGIDKVGLHDNFFDLGGHSLLMVRLQSRLGAVLKMHVAVLDLFRYPTISALSRHLSQASSTREVFEPVQQRAEKQRELLVRRQPQRVAGGGESPP
jgi:hypothetical protein